MKLSDSIKLGRRHLDDFVKQYKHLLNNSDKNAIREIRDDISKSLSSKEVFNFSDKHLDLLHRIQMQAEHFEKTGKVKYFFEGKMASGEYIQRQTSKVIKDMNEQASMHSLKYQNLLAGISRHLSQQPATVKQIQSLEYAINRYKSEKAMLEKDGADNRAERVIHFSIPYEHTNHTSTGRIVSFIATGKMYSKNIDANDVIALRKRYLRKKVVNLDSLREDVKDHVGSKAYKEKWESYLKKLETYLNRINPEIHDIHGVKCAKLKVYDLKK